MLNGCHVRMGKPFEYPTVLLSNVPAMVKIHRQTVQLTNFLCIAKGKKIAKQFIFDIYDFSYLYIPCSKYSNNTVL